MRVIAFILLLFNFVGIPEISAQSKEDLSFYADALSNSFFAQNRVKAQDSFIQQIQLYLTSSDGFDRNLDFLPWLSILYPADSTFRIVTWQLEKAPSEFQYFGFLQEKTGKLFMFEDKADKARDLEYGVLKADEWYGAKYYALKSFEFEGDTSYLLFGFDAFEKYNNKRVIDVLSFDKGKIKFGKPVFLESEEQEVRKGKSRITMLYSADSRVVCSFDEDLGVVIKDHLIPINGRYPGQGRSYVPDGSYEGYKYQDGYWIYQEKLFDHTYDKAPENPPLNLDKQLDLFGRKKG